MNLIESRLKFKHSLMISQKFSSFWQGYRRAVIIFYLIKGLVFLFSNRQSWDDASFFYSTLAISMSVLSADVLNVSIYVLIFVLTCCCGEKLQFRMLGHIFIICMVVSHH